MHWRGSQHPRFASYIATRYHCALLYLLHTTFLCRCLHTASPCEYRYCDQVFCISILSLLCLARGCLVLMYLPIYYGSWLPPLSLPTVHTYGIIFSMTYNTFLKSFPLPDGKSKLVRSFVYSFPLANLISCVCKDKVNPRLCRHVFVSVNLGLVSVGLQGPCRGIVESPLTEWRTHRDWMTKNMTLICPQNTFGAVFSWRFSLFAVNDTLK